MRIWADEEAAFETERSQFLKRLRGSKSCSVFARKTFLTVKPDVAQQDNFLIGGLNPTSK